MPATDGAITLTCFHSSKRRHQTINIIDCMIICGIVVQAEAGFTTYVLVLGKMSKELKCDLIFLKNTVEGDFSDIALKMMKSFMIGRCKIK